jgi:hypothetical protein
VTEGKEIPLAIEGQPPGRDDPRVIEPGALRWTDKPIPVTWYDPKDPGASKVVGMVTGLRREGDTIYGTVSTVEGFDLTDDLAPSIEVSEIKARDGEGMNPWPLRGGRLRGVHLLNGFRDAPWADRLRRGKPPAEPRRESAVQPWMGGYRLDSFDYDGTVILMHGGHEVLRDDGLPPQDDNLTTWHDHADLAEVVARAQEHDATCEDRP